MATQEQQQKLQQAKAQYEADYKTTIAERRQVAVALNDPSLTEAQRNALNVRYQELDTKATQLDRSAISTTEELNRVTNQINQGPNPPIAGPGAEIPPFANQNTGGTVSGVGGRYQQAVADDQVRLNEANQKLLDTNRAITAAEQERNALSAQLRSAAPGSPEQAALLARRNQINNTLGELETQRDGLTDDIRVRENSLATNKNSLSQIDTGIPERVTEVAPAPVMVTPIPAGTPVPNTTITDGVDAIIPVPVTDGVDQVIPISGSPDQEEISVENAARPPLGIGGNYASSFNPETGTYDVVNLDTGQVVESGLSQLNAEVTASQFSQGDPQFETPEPPPDLPDVTEPDPPGGNFVSTFDPETQTWAVVNNDTGEIVQSGFSSEVDAELQAQLDSQPDPYANQFTDDDINESFQESDLIREPTDQDRFEEYSTEGFVETDTGFYELAEDVDQDPYADLVEQTEAEGGLVEFTENGPVGRNTQELAAETARIQAQVAQARAQATIEQQRKQANEGDWRVKLRLAGGADYLYRQPGLTADGILYPLQETDGVIFPYMPAITTTYMANYNSYDLTHSNYRGYFYQNSAVDEINIQAVFTAQDTREANYLLAVIHFFRSVTKMFYGKDPQRGTPPPLVFLQGLGEYQFNLHPCVVKSFNFNLPNDVDYIRARSVNVNGTNLLPRRTQASLPSGPAWLSQIRLSSSGLNPGAFNPPPAPPTLGINKPTYVPTKMDIQIVLLPIQTRSQQSQQFSLKQYANGDLIKGGFW